MPNPPTERDWLLVTEMVKAALERLAAEEAALNRGTKGNADEG